MSRRKSLIARCETVLAAVQWLSIFTASIALIILIVTFGWLVYSRYILNASATWVEQLALMLICYIAFLGAAAGVREETHLGVTLFRDAMPVVIQKVVIILIDFILAAFGVIMVLAGVELMQFGWDSLIPMLNIPESFRTLAITLCGALVCLHAGSRGFFRLLTFTDWRPQDDAPQDQPQES